MQIAAREHGNFFAGRWAFFERGDDPALDRGGLRAHGTLRHGYDHALSRSLECAAVGLPCWHLQQDRYHVADGFGHYKPCDSNHVAMDSRDSPSSLRTEISPPRLPRPSGTNT